MASMKWHPALENLDRETRGRVISRIKEHRQRTIEEIVNGGVVGNRIQLYESVCQAELRRVGVYGNWNEVLPVDLLIDHDHAERLVGSNNRVLIEKICWYCGVSFSRHYEANCVRNLKASDPRRISWDRGRESARMHFRVTSSDYDDPWFKQGVAAYKRNK